MVVKVAHSVLCIRLGLNWLGFRLKRNEKFRYLDSTICEFSDDEMHFICFR